MASYASTTKRGRHKKKGSQSDSKDAPKVPVVQPKTDEERAATRLQATFRGYVGRKKTQHELLKDTWNQLDWKEESELKESNRLYSQLKKQYGSARGAADAVFEIKDKEQFEAKIVEDLKKLELEHTRKGVSPHYTADGDVEIGELSRMPLLEPFGEAKLNLLWVEHMMDEFKQNKILQPQNVTAILQRVVPILKGQPNVVDLEVEENNTLTVVGDLHGQLDDLFTIFKFQGLPSERNHFLFNGDFVDRGAYSCEIVLTLFALTCCFPQSMHLNRGNHEAQDINGRDGFEREVLEKYDKDFFQLFSDTFACLPIAHVIAKRVFVVHGGLASRDITIAEIQEINRFQTVPEPNSIFEDLLWSDPCEDEGRYSNSRGCALEFGPDVVDRFMETNGIDLILRSHECVDYGYDEWFDGRLVTIFSASNYCDTVDNDGGFAVFRHDLIPNYVAYRRQAKEELRPYRMRTKKLEEDVVSKLLTRISLKRLALVAHFHPIAEHGAITRQQWSDGLKKVLELEKVPFLTYQYLLGLPRLGLDSQPGGPIDYMTFLERFRPINNLLHQEPESKDDSPVSPTSAKDFEKFVANITELLFVHRCNLEALFRFFDLNGDGKISGPEFRDGIKSLLDLLDNDYQDSFITSLVKHIDTNDDGDIDYNEFFNKFQAADPSLAIQAVAPSKRPAVSATVDAEPVTRAF